MVVFLTGAGYYAGDGSGVAQGIATTIPATQDGDLVVLSAMTYGNGTPPLLETTRPGWSWTQIHSNDTGPLSRVWVATSPGDEAWQMSLESVESEWHGATVTLWRDAVLHPTARRTDTRSGSEWVIPTLSAPEPGVVVHVDACWPGTGGGWSYTELPPPGWTERAVMDSTYAPEVGVWSAPHAGGTTATGTLRMVGGFTGGPMVHGQFTFLLTDKNRPPNAPALATLVNGGAIDRGRPNRARHVFSDPNAGDSQSAFDIRWRPVGDANWTTVHAPVPNEFYDFPAGTFEAGGYERQVRTYDAQGLAGPWSTSGFFTAGDSPAGPSILYPIAGQQLEQNERVTWSTATQVAFQVRRVGDTGGAPDESVVYYDSGRIASVEARFLPLVFETNGRAEHVQVRVEYGDLWSPWVSVGVEVSYTPPPTPSFTIAADPKTASLTVTLFNPLPAGDDPPASYNDVYVTEPVDGVLVEQRRATRLPQNTTWRYWTPISGHDYSAAFRVVAVAANGTTASSS
ncbi:hypothetical protein QWY28_13195 [Nocardioides sp. SOB77]|uniref:Fibronectin type III domain-containing protein n=1 Tax=Nocardioides oceani TaxID=3058369 RepID=A0ABT8FHJ3_9ACTN|nr:hypothetical protein [Nocardioides oceani]MDN4173910.1 hypothetical protein [Nocardioides oceani]